MRLQERGKLPESQRLVHAHYDARAVSRGVDGGDTRTQGVTDDRRLPEPTSSTAAVASPTSDCIEYSGAAEDAP